MNEQDPTFCWRQPPIPFSPEDRDRDIVYETLVEAVADALVARYEREEAAR